MQDSVINGRYKVIRELGQGGMGRVLLVEDQHRKNQRLALKTLLLEDGNSKSIERFCVEFTGLSKLRHPNIAAACDFGKIAGTCNYFFTTEYVDGIDLFRGTVNASTGQLVDILAQTLRGLEFIHSNGYLHNDLKPGNILLELCPPDAKKRPRQEREPAEEDIATESPIGRVKIIDFGLFAAEKTSWEDLFGTPQFLSPERIRGLPTDRRSDLYSAGFIFYLLFSRMLPFNDRDSETVLNMHLEAQVPSLSFFRPDLPVQLTSIIERLMRKDPDDRFQSAEETLELLEESMQRRVRAQGGARSPDLAAGHLFERENELIQLEERFCTVSAVATDMPSVVVRGPSGIGKTRLVRELRGFVQVSNGAYIEVSGKDPGATVSHAAEVILRGLETSGANLDDVRASLADLPADSPLVLSIVETAILRHAQAIPILLHFDDFQRSPKDIRALALGVAGAAKEHLAAGSAKPKLLVVLSICTDDRRRDPNGLEDFPALDLQPFSEESARMFAKELFGQDDIPPEVLEAIVQCSHGIPGRLFELAADLVDAEVVQHTGSRWVFPGEA